MDMGDMDMGGPAKHACKIAMTWNWYTVDACFISQQLHIRSKGAFAATVIMIFIITALVEGVRRAGREYDRRLLAQARAQAPLDSPALDAKSKGSDYTDSAPRRIKVNPTMVQQLIRVSFFGVQFATAYILMLLAMYYNGYIIGAIICGGITGFAIFARDTLGEVDYEGGAACC